jgi:hypothetical protein
MTDAEFDQALRPLRIRFEAIAPETAAMAGRLSRQNRLAARLPRRRLIADFLIGAHAARQADALLSSFVIEVSTAGPYTFASLIRRKAERPPVRIHGRRTLSELPTAGRMAPRRSSGPR